MMLSLLSVPLVAHDLESNEVIVTIEQMEEALWYYENYFIQLDRADSFELLYNQQKELTEEATNTADTNLIIGIVGGFLTGTILGIVTWQVVFH